jgi:hypothetical protein
VFLPIDPMADENQEISNKFLVNFLLNGGNYLHWARAFKLALGGQSKLKHILDRTKNLGKNLATEVENKNEASEAVVEKQGKDVEWEVNDLQVMSQILNSIEPKLYGIFDYTNSSKELWDSIFEMYRNANNSSRVFEIEQSISSLKQEQKQSFLWKL